MSWEGTVGDAPVPIANGRPGRLSVGRDDGEQVLDIAPLGGPEETRFTIVSLFAAERFDFDACPICLDPKPESPEHVGPEAAGGRIMTKTCTPCNNVLGSRIDAALVHWCTDSMGRVRVTSDAFPGHRFLPFDLRSTAQGEPVFLSSGPISPDVEDALTSGHRLEVSVEMHDMTAVRMSALKNAYLAAAIILRRIPMGPDAVAIRALLTAVRDASRGAALPEDPRAQLIPLGRSLAPPTGPAVVLAGGQRADGSGPRQLWISFSRVFATGWPLRDEIPDLPAEHDDGASASDPSAD